MGSEMCIRDRARAAESAAESGAEGDGDFLRVAPVAGRACVFFPADAAGTVDPRLVHAGAPAVDEKWLARIFKHQFDVSEPFGVLLS